MLWLAWRGELALVGLITLGLAVHAPLVAFGNLNLRQLVALDTSQSIDPRYAFGLRACVALAAALITGGVLALVAPPDVDWIAAWIFVGSRIADNVAEVALR